MVESLAKRRRELLNEERPPSPYHGFCAQVFSNASAEYQEIVEVVSDDLGYDEPIWDSLWSAHSFEPPPLEDQRDHRQKIKERRETVTESLEFPTHLSIGKRLFESALFLVCKTSSSIEVRYQSGDHWSRLAEGGGPLPVILLAEELGITDRRDKICAEIENTLRILSRDVIWPVLWPDCGGLRSGWSFVSLVLVKASMWQVPGVWALHAAYLSPEALVPRTAPNSLLHMLIHQPSSCIQDVLGALFRQHHPQAHQEWDVSLLRSCKGGRLVRINPGAGLGLQKDEKVVFDRGLILDPTKRFGELFEHARRYWTQIYTTKNKVPPSIVPGQQCQGLMEAILGTFVAWQLTKACQLAPDSLIPRLLIDDAVRTCSSNLAADDIEALKAQHPDLYSILETLTTQSCMLTIKCPNGAQMSERQSKAYAPALTTRRSALTKSELVRFFIWLTGRIVEQHLSVARWLLWNDLRILLLSEPLPTSIHKPLKSTVFEVDALQACLEHLGVGEE